MERLVAIATICASRKRHSLTARPQTPQRGGNVHTIAIGVKQLDHSKLGSTRIATAINGGADADCRAGVQSMHVADSARIERCGGRPLVVLLQIHNRLTVGGTSAIATQSITEVSPFSNSLLPTATFSTSIPPESQELRSAVDHRRRRVGAV